MVKNIATVLFGSVEADAVFISQEDFVFYLTGFKSSNGVIITDEVSTKFYTDSRYIEAAERHFQGSGVTVEELKSGELIKLLKSYGKVAMPFSRISAAEYNSFLAEGIGLTDCTRAIVKLMSVKSADEIEAIKNACQISDNAFLGLLPYIKEGVSENEVAARLEYLMRKFGASGTSFETICAFGANGSVPHHETGETKLKFGDVILLDFGCKSGGYCSDCTRTFLFGDDKKHEEFKDYYNRVLEAQTLVKRNFRSGMTGSEGDAIARDHLAKYSLAQYFTHSLGHSLGVNIHELPALSPKEQTIFCDGMVFSDEPGIYIAGKLGIRIEDTVTLSEGKVVSLTNIDRNLLIL